MSATTLESIDVPRADADEMQRSRPWWHRVDTWVGLFVVAACAAFVFNQLEPSLIFRNTTPAGGDTMAHVWWPAYLRDHLLPSLRLAGWSPDYYAGFPAGQYYFPFPALLIVALDVFIPYNVAFKLVTALGPVTLPIAAYVLGRGLKAPRPAPAFMAVGVTFFLFFVGDATNGTIAFNQRIMGGTIASTLAGEFSFTIALSCGLAFLGTLAMSLRTGRRLWLPAMLLAAAVMSHLIVAIFVAIGGLAVWLAHRPGLRFKRAAAIGVVGTLLTAVWALPLMATLGYTTDMRYDPIGPCPAGAVNCADFGAYLFPKYIWGVTGIFPWQWGGLLVAAAIVGPIARRGRRSTATAVIVTITAVMGILFRFWEQLQSTTVWNLRFLPFWYLGVFLVMALGAAEIVRGIAWGVRWLYDQYDGVAATKLVRAVTIGGLTVLSTLGALVYISNDTEAGVIPLWARYNYRGVEDTVGQGSTPPKAYPEYRKFIDTVAALPPGRLLWEGNQQLDHYGSPLSLMLLPYWTHGRISSMEGVYYEASATTPYHFMTVATLAGPGNNSNAVRGVPYRTMSDFALGVRWLQLLGVRYLAVHSVASKQAADADRRLDLVATSPDTDNLEPLGWNIYRVEDSSLVEPLRFQPVVVNDVSGRDLAACKARVREQAGTGHQVKIHDWTDCVGVPWFNTPEALDRPLVADGPSSWQHAGSEEARTLERKKLPDVRVTNVRADDNSVSFDVSRPGVPVYVKTSFFPNWKVSGATGPYRATPNFMVVVPKSRHVTLEYGVTTAEWIGRVGTLAGIAGLVAMFVWPRWRRRRTRIGELDAPIPATE
jgi:6-pyruvoyl-tetrahydropterin synthase related domain